MRNSKFRVAVLIVFFTLILTAGCNTTCRKSSDYCSVKYPVLLVHGIAFRDKTFFLRYWGKIPALLEKSGARVYTGRQEASGTIPSNAAILKERVEEILKATGSEKVNIIAHSRGGLEARYMISVLGMKDKVASLTTLATPHRGSTMADFIIKHIKDKKSIIGFLDFYARVIGDDNPESLNAGIELTTSRMKIFNVKVKDSGGIYYQSWAGSIDDNYGNPLWRKMYKKIAEKEGANDGLVSVESAKWGVFRGVVSCDGKALVSHADIIGLHFLFGEKCFDAEGFILDIVHELKIKGY